MSPGALTVEQTGANHKGAMVVFFTYRQRSNNGAYTINDDIAHYACVEADTEQRAHAILVGLSDKATWEMISVDEMPMFEHGKRVMPLNEFILSKYNQHRRRAVVYYADGRREMY